MWSPDPGLENLAKPLPLPSSLSPLPVSASVWHPGQLPAQHWPYHCCHLSPRHLHLCSPCWLWHRSSARRLFTGGCGAAFPAGDPVWAPECPLHISLGLLVTNTQVHVHVCLALLMSCQGRPVDVQPRLAGITPCTAPTYQSFLSLCTWSQSMGSQMLVKVIYGRLLPG